MVDPTTIETFVRAVPFEGEPRDGNETEEGQNKLVKVSGQVGAKAHSEEVKVQVYQPTSRCILACRA